MAHLLLFGRPNLARLRNLRNLVATVLAVGFCSRALAEGGYLDTTFQPGIELEVRSMAMQMDGRIVVGGPSGLLVRLRPHGVPDPTFAPQVAGSIEAVGVQPDGLILAGGVFSLRDHPGRTNLVRFHADGSVDETFHPDVGIDASNFVLQPDGKILIAAYFGNDPGPLHGPLSRVYRLNADGGLDPSFARPEFAGYGNALALQADGRIVVGGDFVRFAGVTRNGLARLNPDGTLDPSFDAGVDLGPTPSDGYKTVLCLAVQPDGKILVGGSFTQISGASRYQLGRLNPDGSLDTAFYGVRTTAMGSVTSLAVGSHGEILVGAKGYTSLVRLAPDGTGGSFSWWGSAGHDDTWVNCILVQPMGGVIVGGKFDQVYVERRGYVPWKSMARFKEYTADYGRAVAEPDGKVLAFATRTNGSMVIGGRFTKILANPRGHLGQILTNRTEDPYFEPNLNGTVYGIALQPDGKAVVAGDFSNASGLVRNRLARMSPHGTVDAGFNPDANDTVYGATLQPDGKLVVVGAFTSIGGYARQRVARLHPDGTVDVGFDPGANGEVLTAALQPDGKLILGGSFTVLGGEPHRRVARVHGDGTVDRSFKPDVGGDVPSSVFCVLVQPDGRILIGGNLNAVDGVPRDRIARLQADGRLDEGFNAAVAGTVMSIALQADGYLIIGGAFTSVDGVPRNGIARLKEGGGLDADWDPDVAGQISGVMLQRDGKFLVGGDLSAEGGTLHTYFSQLDSGPGFERMSAPDPTVLRWIRGGTAPEVSGVAFDLSTDRGVTWMSLGLAEHMAGGWRKTGLALPRTGLVRASGRLVGGFQNGSSTWVESVVAIESLNSPPVVVNPIPSRILAEDDDISVVLELNSVFYDAETPVPALELAVSNTDPDYVLATINHTADTLTQRHRANRFGIAEITVTAMDASGQSVGTTFTVSTAQVNDGDPGDLDTGYGAYDFVYDISDIHEVLSIAVEPDGRNLFGGYFGEADSRAASGLRRKDAEGGLVLAFEPRIDGNVSSLAVQRDGRIVIAGEFGVVNTIARPRLARLNRDGSLDPGFGAEFAGTDDAGMPRVSLNCLALQPDGKVVVGGDFGSVNGAVRKNVVRFHGDGTVDTDFAPDIPGPVDSLALQADGRLVVGGRFAMSRDTHYWQDLARLETDGSFDESFQAMTLDGGGVSSLAVQPDGKILVGGAFDALFGNERAVASERGLARLNADGTLDPEFNLVMDHGDDSAHAIEVASIVLQADGKILIGGAFRRVNGSPRFGFARLLRDGTVDADFNTSTSGDVHGLALQANGRVLLLGGLDRLVDVMGAPGRLLNDPARQRLSAPTANRVQWSRGGSAPEATDVTFELSTDGSVWTALGTGVRMAGGWEKTGVELPASGWLRARARVVGGHHNGSVGLVESIAPFPSTEPPDNTPPTVAAALPGVTVNEDAAQRVIPLRGVFRDAETADGDLVYTVRGDSVPSLLDASIDNRADTLTLQFRHDAHGLSTLRIRATDDGGASVESDFVVTVTPINDPPSVTLPGLVTVAQDSGDYAGGAGFSVFSPGPANESDQAVLSYTLTHDNAALFSTQPAIDATGTLTFTPAPGASGNANVAVVFQDNGGVEFGGIDTATETFRIVITPTFPVGDLDPGFAPGVFGSVSFTLEQPDLKWVAGGNFASVAGSARSGLARMNRDGSLDGFDPHAGLEVTCAALQPDGKLLIGGSFTDVGWTIHRRLARLNPDGTADMAFSTQIEGDTAIPSVTALQVLPNGKILVAGDFTRVNGILRLGLARLQSDGTLDAGFDPFLSGGVRSFAVQNDGKVILVGGFTSLGGVARNRVARLNEDGSLDASFNPNANNSVTCVAIQPDGKVLLGGTFTVVRGVARQGLARLNADGSIESGFNPGFSTSTGNLNVKSLVLPADGKVIAVGNFTAVGGTSRQRLARLNPDGSLDSRFSVETDGDFLGAMLQEDGRLVVSGRLGVISGQARNGVARWFNDPSVENLSVPVPGRVQWLRSGASPEAQDVAFELSVNAGATWTPLGRAVRIEGGWALEGLSLPPAGHVRARARIVSGYRNGSSGLVESIAAFGPGSVRPPSAPTVVGPLADLALDEDASEVVIGLRGVFQDAETAAANLTHSIQANSNPGLVTATINGTDDTLKLRVQPDQFGLATLVVRATDAEGLRVDDTFVVTVNPVNDAPRLAFAGNVTVLENTGPYAAGTGFAVFTPGPANESDQTPIGYALANSNPGLFAAPPALDVSGRLSFTPLAGASGEAAVTVVVQDNGGVARGGIDRATQSFLISILPVASSAGLVDPSFLADMNGAVQAIAVQPDGKILIGGMFTHFGPVNRPYLARLNADGSLDAAFNPDPENTVSSMVVQPDGKILVGGSFRSMGGVPRKYLARLNADGSLDAGFDPSADNIIISMALLPDGRILVVGVFKSVQGVANNYICQLLPDGTVDPSFVSPLRFEFGLGVYSIALRPDGKWMITGEFMATGGTEGYAAARLNPDGSFDSGFSARFNSGGYALALQPDGRILIGGRFSASAGEYFYNFARMNEGGDTDHSFKPDPFGGVVTVSLQADGRSIIGGGFATLGTPEIRRDKVARINANGALDLRFDTPIPDVTSVPCIALQADGRILIAGNFTMVNGLRRPFLARLLNDPVVDTLNITSGAVEWLRGGSAPETFSTTFELSTDAGASWTALGAGVRFPGGWRRSGLSLPTRGLLRARARVHGGFANGSMGLVESVKAFPDVTVPPVRVSVGLLANGSVRLNFEGTSGTRYTVLGSHDLLLPATAWTVLGTATEVSPGRFEFVDLTTGSAAPRFWMIVARDA